MCAGDGKRALGDQELLDVRRRIVRGDSRIVKAARGALR